MPSKHAKKEWEKIAEENLRYVAITRAKKTLNFISEDLFPAKLFGENDDLISELEYQRERMNRALHTNSQAMTTSSLSQDKQIAMDAAKIMNTNNVMYRTTNEKKRRNIGGNKMSKFLK
jgi:ATP-dependent exoDNAse (exonuclease V) beta subunit